MNSIERIQATINFQKPDRVPVDLHNFQPAAKKTGLSLSEVLKSGDLLAEAMIQAWREFNHDMILLENGTACNAQACGVEVIYRDDMAPVALRPVLKDLEDLVNIQIPDPYKTFPMNEILKATRILSKEIGDKVWICGRADQGPVSLSAQMRGIDNFFIDIAMQKDPAKIEALLDFSLQVSIRYAVALLESGAHSISIGESISGPTMLSPKHYRRYAAVYQKKFINEMKKRKGIVHLHICGNVGPILVDFVDTGAHILEIDHKTDMAAAKEVAQRKAALLGNIDTGLLVEGTYDQVLEASKKAIRVLGKGNGFILGPGCAMGSETPAENIHALVEAAKSFGEY